MAERLKPCPFCDSEATLTMESFWNWPEVCCDNRKCSANVVGENNFSTIAAWNRRAPSKKEE